MRDKNNELTVIKKSVFDKVKDFFKNIFSRLKMENDSSNCEQESKMEEEDVQEKVNNSEDSKDKEKKEFFVKYKNYKEGKIESASFSGAEKVKLNSMLNEEFNLSKKKLEKIVKEYNER